MNVNLESKGFIVTDCQGKFMKEFEEHLKKKGYEIHNINLSDAQDGERHGIDISH